MSRTIRHRTPSNGFNDYAVHKRKVYLERGLRRGETTSQAIDYFLFCYRHDGYSDGVPKTFRQSLNRSKKSKLKQILHHALVNDRFDDLPTLHWHKDAYYHYW